MKTKCVYVCVWFWYTLCYEDRMSPQRSLSLWGHFFDIFISKLIIHTIQKYRKFPVRGRFRCRVGVRGWKMQ